MQIKIKRTFSLLFILMTIMSVSQWCSIPLGNTLIDWLIDFSLLALAIVYAIRVKNKYETVYIVCIIYLAWLVTSVARGIFIADNYWEYKNLVTGTLALSMPAFVFFFSSPRILKHTLKYWNLVVPFVFLILIFFISRDSYHFLLAPILIYGCFLNQIPRPWRYVVFAILLLMLVADIGARAQMIKSMASLLCSVVFIFRKYIKQWLFHSIHLVLYFIPVGLLLLGVSGRFNIFEKMQENEGKVSSTKTINGEEIQEDIADDTRTFIYVEVLSSAIKNHYVLFGRTPARGNDSDVFGQIMAIELNTGKYERYRNEVCHPNVFTWLGLIGLILHCMIYIQASVLAVYRSNNMYMRFLGIMIAFNWLIGWIENTTGFDIMNFTIWIMISMGLSSRFRGMSDSQFKAWFISLFTFKKHPARNEDIVVV